MFGIYYIYDTYQKYVDKTIERNQVAYKIKSNIMTIEDWDSISIQLGSTLSGREIKKDVTSYINKVNLDTSDEYLHTLRCMRDTTVYQNNVKLHAEIMCDFRINHIGRLALRYISSLEAVCMACGFSATVIPKEEYIPFKMFLDGLCSDLEEMYHKINNSMSKRHFEDGVYLRAKRDYAIAAYIIAIRKRLHLKHRIWHDANLPHITNSNERFQNTLLRNKAILSQCEGRREFAYILETIKVDKVMHEGENLELDLSRIKHIDSTLQDDSVLGTIQKEGVKHLKGIINGL